LARLETDADLEACSKGQRYVAGSYDKEYEELLLSVAQMQHAQMLNAVRRGDII
jgi:hypothetical protein